MRWTILNCRRFSLVKKLFNYLYIINKGVLKHFVVSYSNVIQQLLRRTLVQSIATHPMKKKDIHEFNYKRKTENFKRVLKHFYQNYETNLQYNTRSPQFIAIICNPCGKNGNRFLKRLTFTASIAGL